MNKTYRIVWNETTNTWVAVAEIAKAHGKSASVGGGIVASCTQVGARFAFTAAASAVLMMGAPAMAANGTEYQSGTDNLCYYDTTSQSVVCGSNATNTADTSGGKPAKSVVMGLDSANTGESNVTIGSGAKTIATHSLKTTIKTAANGSRISTQSESLPLDTTETSSSSTDASGVTTTIEVVKNSQPSAAIAIGQEAKVGGGYGIALGYHSAANRAWDISIGRHAGAEQNSTQAEGRNIAIGDGALRGATSPNNNIAMGTDAGRNTTGTGNVMIGTYANSPTANGAAITANNVVAMGERAVASSGSAVAVGARSKSSGAITVAVGASANASGNYAIAQGFAAQATGTSSVAIGSAQNLPNQTRATAHYGTAIGFAANAGAEGAIAIGRHANHDISSSATNSTGRAKTTGANSIAIGTDTNAAGQSSNAIGNTATATGKDSASFGSKATATHESALAVGSAAQATDTNAVAVGGGAVASKVGASALGRGANATAANAVAVGIDSLADKDNAVAVGVNSKAQNNSNIAVGNLATATGATSAIAVGRQSVASGTSSIATGYKSAASTENSIAIGNTAAANGGAGAIAVGKGTTATGTSAVVMGTDSQGTAQSVVVIGNASQATADNAVVIGIKANATGSGNVAIGENAGEAHSSNLQGSNTVLIGVKAGSQSTNNQAQVAVGWQAGQGTLGAYNVASGYQAGQFVNGENNVAFGKGAGSGTSATARLAIKDTVAIGTGAKATADNAIAIGKGAQANAINTISIGTGNIVNGAGSGAIGDPSTVNGEGSYSLGNDNTITTNDTFVIGNDVTQTLANSVILGDSSSASGINTGTYTLDGTQDSKVKGVTDVVGVVSVGTAGQTRQIQNVAAGVVSATSTDAINGSQLYAVAKELKDGQTHYYSVNSTKTATGDNYNNEGATGQNALAAGVTTSATATDAVAVGSDAIASGEQSLALGNNVQATHVGATAVGNNSRALADGAQAFGQSSQATAKDSAAMGRYARATAERATAVGVGNVASGTSSFAGGDASTAAGAQSVAIGLSANSAASNTIAMGSSAQATKEGAIAIGTSTVSGSTNSVVLGTNAKVERDVSTSNVIIGHNAKAVVSSTFPLTELGKDAVAIGFESQVGAASNVAIGSNAKAIGNSEAIAIGYKTDALGYQSAAFGSGAKTSDNAGSSLALGREASATVANGVALGSNSVADVLFGATGADPLNAATDKTTSTWKATHAAVSVGNGTTVTRQITSVAAGTNDTDAVNVAQLKAAGFTLAATASDGELGGTVTDDKIQNGETVTVDAGKNIKVTHTANQVSIATKDDVAFTTVTTTDAAGNKTVLNGTGMTITPTGGANPVSLTSAGLNNGGNKITNVADGNIASGSKEAVNGGQIFDLKQELTVNSGNISKGLDFAGNTGDFNRQLGEKTTISGGLTDTTKSSSNSNIRTVANNGTIDIQLADAPVFTGKVSAQGLDAGGQKITNVAKGSDDADAVNVKQLQESLANITVTNQSLVQANSPFSYVNSAGEQLIRHVDGSGNITFTKASDGSTYSNSDITISALNPSASQTATPTIVGNIADGKANNDAVNVSQLKNAVEVLGAGATVNSDGTIKQPTYTVKGNTFSNVGGAINALDKAVQTPLTFSGDNATEKVKRELGTELAVKGGSTANLTDGNIGVVGSATDNSLTIKLAEKINLGTAGSVTTGDTKVDNAGVTIEAVGKTPVSLTNAGLDNGGNVISNVGAGKANTDAVNVSQLTPLATALGVNVDPNSGIVAAPSFVVTKTDGSTYAGATTIQGALNNIGTEIQKGITFAGNSGQAVKKLGETFNIKGTLDNAATASDKNIRTEVDGNGVMSIKLAESPKFGNVTINDAGKITGVTAGTQDTDAVNVAQLNAKTATTPLIVGNTGAVDTPADTSKLATAGDIADAINKAGFTLTTAKTTDGELGATATNELINAGDTVTVEADKNIKVTQTNGKISIATKDAVNFNNVTAGSGANQVVLGNDGVKVGGKTYISDAGLNANDKKITNVANGDVTSTSKDAINGSQLHAVSTATKNLIGGNATVNSDGTVTASNIGGTGANSIDDAIKTVKTTVKSTDKTIKVTANTADAANGTIFDISVDAQKLAESAQLPVVYTDADGNKVYKVGNKFTKDPTGQDATQEVTATNVIASMQNADGTISPTTLANIKAGTKDTDAVNVSQLQGAVDALGGGATINTDGTIKAPSYSITNPANGTVTTANNVGDALKGLNDAVNSPLTFKGDSGEFNRNLGQTTTVKGGITDTAKLSDNNIGVVAKDGALDIKLAKDIVVDSVTTGGTKLSDAGLSFVDTSGSPVANSPSISKTGINAGNQVIAGVTAGTADTDAVNVAQLNAKTATTPLTVGNTGVVDTPASTDANKLATAGDIANAINKAGFTLTTAKTTDGELGANSTSNELINAGDTVTVEADKNIKVTQTNGKISIATKDAVSFNSVTAGTGTNVVVLDDKGVNVGGNTYISDAGLNANDKKITNVANGDVTSASKDAINGSQLRNTADDIASIIGGNATVDNAGNVTASNIGGTGATTIDNAIKTVKTTVKSTDNTIKVTTNTANANDGTVFDISVDSQKLAESAQLPVVYTKADGTKVYKVGNSFFDNKDGTGTAIDATDVIASMQNADGTTSTATKLANIAKGEVSSTSKDAINGSQLFAQGEGVKNIIGGNTTTYDPATGTYTNNNIGGTGKGNINDAIQTVNTKADTNATEIAKGLNFGANDQTATSGDAINRKLGETIGIKGGITDATTATSGENVITRTDTNGNINIELAKNAKFDSVTTGGTKLSDAGLSFVDASGSPVASSPSISKTGINAGNQVIAGVKAGTQDTDAVNVSQLKGAVDALGGGAAINTDGTITAPTYNITNPANGTVTTANNVGDALKGLNDAVNSPLTFKGDSGEFNRNLGQTTTVKGGITDTTKLSDNNIGVVAKDGALDIKLAKDIAVDSVKAGDTTVNTYGVSIANADPNKVVSLTASGLNNGNNRITNVAAGQAGTDAVNKDQLDKAKAAASNKVKAGDNIEVAESKNADGSTTYTVATADEVAFDKATVGGVVVDGTSNKVSGLANGDVSATSTDAINGSQLFATNQNVANNATEIAKGINFGGTTGSNNYALGDTINVKGDSNINSETVAGGVQLKLNDVISVGTAKPVQIDGTKGTVGGLTNTAWDADNIVSGQAATEDQLKSAVSAAQAAATTKVVEGKNVKVAEQINADGSTTYTVATADEVAFDKVSVGGVVVDGTSNKISGLASGNVSATSTNAINGSQLYGTANSVATALGGGATVQADGTVSAPTYNIINPVDGTVTKANNVGDALKGLNDAVNSPLIFAGDSGKNVERKLGTTLGIKGGVTDAAKLSQNNIGVVSNGTDTLEIQLAKELTGLTSVSTGNTVMNNDGVTITGTGGAKPVSLTNAGLDNGGNKITNVAAGEKATDAVNKGQLDAAQAAASNKVTAGDNIEVAESKNADGSTTYTVATAKDVNFNSVTAGTGANQVVLGDDGVKVGGNTYISNAGLNANDKKITNVAAGTVAKDSKDAINGSQLFAQGEGVQNIIGGNTTYDPTTGTYTNNNIGGTGKGNINDAIQTVNTKADTNANEIAKGLNFGANDQTATSGDAINRKLGETIGIKGGITDATTATSGENVITRTDTNGNINIELAKNAKFDSVNTGNTLVDNSGITIKAPTGGTISDVKLTAGGLDNGGNKITNVAAGTDATDAVNKDQLDKVQAAASNKVKAGDNIEVAESKNADGSTTYTVATAKDVNFNSVTAGSGANQVVLDDKGVNVGGKTYISDAGLNANDKKITNIANGNVSATSTDAINGSQLYGTANSMATALGGGATVQADGTVSAPTYNITNPADGTVTKANNVGDALKGLNDAVNSPLIFAGDSGKNVERKLGTTLGIKGGVTDAAKLSQNNIGVVSNGTDTLEIQLAKELTGLTSVSTGNTVMNNDGVTITGAGGAKPVSLTNAGLDNGGNKITNVAEGTNATDAVNKDQLDKAQAAASNKVKAGDNIEVAESKNVDGSTTYTVATAKDVNFNSVTAGTSANQVVLGDDGVKVGGNTYISNAGLNANDKKITNVAAGTVAKDSKDAINGSQLFAQGEGVKNIIGGNTVYDPATGTYTNSNIGGTGKGNINDAIQAINTAATKAKSTVTAGDNIVVTPSQNADGSTNYTVATAKDLTVDSIKAGDTTINNAGVTVGDKVALTNTGLTAGDVKVSTDGINAGNKVITGVASGLNGKTLDQIKADPNAAERTNAASIGDLAEVQSNVTNITNNVTNITNNVLNGNTKDANGNTVTYVDDSGNLTDAGKVALTTYNVSGQTEFVHNSVISAIQQMNNEGIKYFHTNDGQTPVAENTNSQDSSASGKYASAVGYQTSSSGENATAVGSSLTVTTDSQTAGATVTEVTENGQTVLKQRTTASGARAVALGAGSQALGADSIAIGTGNVVSGKGSGAIGDPTVVTGESAYSIGNNNTVSANNAYALGSNITANVADSVYLGDRTTTSGVHIANPANGSTYTYGGLNDANVAGVTGSTAPANNVVGVVAVGNNADEVRQIQGVAAGVVSPTSTDAINGSQLYDTHQAIGNVANYTVNMGNQLNQRIDGVEKRSNAGTAAAMAVAGLPQAYLPGKSMMAVSGSTYRGESGYAVGFSSISDNGNWIIKGSATGNSRGHYGATAGVGYQW